MATLRFRTRIEIHGINPYVLVPRERAARLRPGWRKPLPVAIRINGQPGDAWHINMMPAGNGDFRLYLHARVRKASQTQVGDQVTVEINFDAAYKAGPKPLPRWFRAALGKNAAARQSWNALPPSRKKEIVRYLANLKSVEARERNLARALGALAGGPDRFLARWWGRGKPVE